DDERPPFRRPRSPRLVLLAAAKSQLSLVDLNRDAARTQTLEPTTVTGMWIERTGDDACNPRSDEGIRTRGRAAMMRARFHRHVRRRAVCAWTCELQRDRLCMRTARLLVPRLADDLAVVHEHAADDRIRMCRAAPALGQLERSFETHCRAWSSWR